MNRECKGLLASAIACALLPNTRAFAQSQGLEEILVTAQRREQSLQDVPISVTAVTGEAIAEAGFSDVEDMSIFVPNLFMRDAFTGQSIIVRGIGTSTGNEAFEQAVASFSDGVYYGRDNLGQNAVFDLERVEIVRGPQPTFAGQSATAGAINVITRKPGDRWEGNASLAYGTDEETSFDVAAGGPLSDKFGIRFAGRYYDLDDAGYHSIIGNVPQGVKENRAGRITAVWTPSDNVDVTFKYEHQDVWQRGSAGEYTVCETRPQFSRANGTIAPGLPAPCALDAIVNGARLDVLDGSRGTGGSLDIRATVDALNAASGAAPGSANYWGYNSAPAAPPAPAVTGIQAIAYGLNRVQEYNFPEDRDFQADIFLGAVNWQIGDLTLSSNTSFVEYDKEDWLDPDDSSFAVFNDHRLEDFEQTAQELRLTSPLDQKVSWMVGLYYQQHDLLSRIDVYLPRLLGTAAYQPADARAVGFGGLLTEDSEWKSAFFAATWNVANAFRVNFGGRYQDAVKRGRLPAEVAFLQGTNTSFSAFQPIPAGQVGGTPAVGVVEADDFLPELGVEWDMSDDVMGYVKYAEAFKNGGFVMSPPVGGGLPDPFSFAPEYAKGYEIGFKSRLADNRVEFNAAAYTTDYTNLQVTVFISAIGRFITTNAAEAHTQGIEFDGRWAASDAFTLGFSGAFGSEAEYDAYDGASCNSLEAKSVPPPCRADRSGVSLPYAPEWTFSFNPDYRWSVGNGLELHFGANVRFSDGYWLSDNEDPRNEVGSFERVDLRLGLSPMDGRWEVALYGRDVTDERLTVGAQPDFQHKTSDPTLYDAFGNTRERGERYGAQFTYRFGS
jgi:outer membrane receptor protein involved in Fe transport